MLLVCLSHFGEVYLDPLGLDGVGRALKLATRAATPAFIVVSGFVLGYLQSSHTDFERLRLKLLDRALYLLTAAHLAIAVAHLPGFGGGAFDIIFMSDVVAISVITGTLVVPVVGGRGRAALGVGLYVGATLLVFGVTPRPGSASQIVKHFLVGHQPELEESAFAYNFPVLQWLGLYLLSTTLGQRLARSREQGEGTTALVRLGLVLTAAGGGLRLLRPVLERLSAAAPRVSRDDLVFLTSPWQKLPPGPAFMLFYGGVAICFVAGCLWLHHLAPDSVALKALGVVGRNSLFVFVLQYYVYYCLVFALHLPYSAHWPLLFAATFLFLVLAAWAWQRIGGARFLTVGYPGLIGWADGLAGRRALLAVKAASTTPR